MKEIERKTERDRERCKREFKKKKNREEENTVKKELQRKTQKDKLLRGRKT